MNGVGCWQVLSGPISDVVDLEFADLSRSRSLPVLMLNVEFLRFPNQYVCGLMGLVKQYEGGVPGPYAQFTAQPPHDPARDAQMHRDIIACGRQQRPRKPQSECTCRILDQMLQASAIS